MAIRLDTPLLLPCGLVLPNRLAKSSLSEGLADSRNTASAAHAQLYARWARGGAGLLITGPVQVDRRYLERAGDISVDGPLQGEPAERLAAVAAAAKTHGARIFLQLSHAGRHALVGWCSEGVGPSDARGEGGAPVVRALAEAEIEDLIRRFVQAACVARDAGFDGVQIQASHGRLLAQFLSPTTNLREDAWGGALEGRARLLIEIARASRAAVGSDFALSVKLGADPEGKDELPLEEAGQVAEWLERERVDLIEAARGPYRGPATAKDAPAMARRRQGYAVAVATAIRARVRAPVMASGGLRDRAVIEELVGEAAVDMVGLGRPLCADPDLPAKFIARSADTAPEIAQAMSDTTSKWASAFGMLEHLQKLHAQAEESWCALAMRDLGEGKAQALKRSARTAVKEYERREAEAVIGLAA